MAMKFNFLHPKNLKLKTDYRMQFRNFFFTITLLVAFNVVSNER